MTPGHELDVLIADKVMLNGCPACEHDGSGMCPDCNGWGRLEPLKPYSTDIAAAWEVLEKLTGRFPYLALFRVQDGPNRWVVSESGDDYASDLARAPTAPHAICLAALAVLAK